jgi:rhodanese-related sulfurtransferase
MAKQISASELHAALTDGGEIALIDVRENGVFARSHILLAVNIPLSRLELDVAWLVPRRSVRLVLCDGGDDNYSTRAARVLEGAGYSDIAILDGGVPAWAVAGYELFSGINVPSKAFGEFVEHAYGTPSIDADDLASLLDREANVVVLDSRPLKEFNRMSIPTGVDVPGGELIYRARELVTDEDALVVVNCAGRTRSIIGAQSLRNAGLPNEVVALRNGTMGWHLAGHDVARGQQAEAGVGPVSGPAKSWATAAAARMAERFQVPTVDAATLATWQADTNRTLYLLDVRDPREFAAGHRPGTRNAPGGQLVQATDEYIAVRNARVVLIDDTGVRATATASWLIQMDWPDVAVLENGLADVELETGDAPQPELPVVAEPQSVSAATLMDLPNRDGTLVIDFATSLEYKAGHIPGAYWAVRSRLAEWVDHLPPATTVVATCPDGRLARRAAAEIAERMKTDVVWLDGGTAAWRDAGGDLVTGFEHLTGPTDDVYFKPYDADEDIEEAMQGYLDWEVALVAQMERDGTLTFAVYPEKVAEG